jgi:hypothetical protein
MPPETRSRNSINTMERLNEKGVILFGDREVAT